MSKFTLFKRKEESFVETGSTSSYDTFSTPFLKVGKGNLSLPTINDFRSGDGYVYFGEENLYPQVLNQMYYTSPLHGSIVDFKTRASVGGGYEIKQEGLSAADKVNVHVFENRLKLRRLTDIIAKELILHARVYFILTFDKEGKCTSTKYVSPDKVRRNRDGSCYYISADWSQSYKIDKITPYGKGNKAERQIYVYEQYSVGQDIYPLPQYSSALNWCFLDGEMSFLHKSNILNSVFPSFAMMFPKKPSSEEEKQAIIDSINKAKGASEAGKVIAFFANNAEMLPKIEAIPVNQNDQLFLQTDERLDGKICQAHQIDPIIFGIRVSGKLGSGTEMEKAYSIFEKNTVMPLRIDIEEIVNDLMDINNVKGEFLFKEFSIIDSVITEEPTPPKS